MISTEAYCICIVCLLYNGHLTKLTPHLHCDWLEIYCFLPTEFCNLNVVEGEGTGFIFSVYYNPLKDQCDPFIYKGEGGNANRFQNERECMRNCSSNVQNTYPFDGKVILHLHYQSNTIIHLVESNILSFRYTRCNLANCEWAKIKK